ncbi:PhaM family polyhydroxyalkanoate granule multifunctional regulatory protein [Rhodoferax sp. BAB1]|uniref:PhaM family polyhydroxyalkanoate granule multifunctional regulatory protein n=1 Tax=Rhodoferax sp. BAB1 TaxID=2741720 RepID=UPI001575C1E2|nr:PhaM family polyhydroxyalkanoate granule multifunctional regulatory protein [Rhodoferax sp. BAB1]QKO23112.1 hypothetical protein HTY51_15080 [Rhodoferax sp. BAB1]
MSNKADPSGFGQFVPGFDFLQKLAQGGQAPMAGWVAPTLDAEALDKRITELKAVQFWLDQNAAALKATIQALEVQKMTLATLKSMNVPMPGAGMAWPMPGAPAAAKPAAAQAPKAAPAAPADKPAAAAAPLADPMQYWGALTQQFQQIAGQAMKDAAARSAAAAAPAKPAPAAKAAKKAAPRKPKPV